MQKIDIVFISACCLLRRFRHLRNKSLAVARAAGGAEPTVLTAPEGQQMWTQFLTYLHNFRYNANFRYRSQIVALQIAAKTLQIATWSLLTAYRNVPLPTHYDVPFSHNT